MESGCKPSEPGISREQLNPFTSTEFSPENQEQINRLIRARWRDFLTTVSQNRGMEFNSLKEMLEENFLYRAEDAVTAGFVDDMVPYDQMIDRLIELGSPDEEYGFNEIALIGIWIVRIQVKRSPRA